MLKYQPPFAYPDGHGLSLTGDDTCAHCKARLPLIFHVNKGGRTTTRWHTTTTYPGGLLHDARCAGKRAGKTQHRCTSPQRRGGVLKDLYPFHLSSLYAMKARLLTLLHQTNISFMIVATSTAHGDDSNVRAHTMRTSEPLTYRIRSTHTTSKSQHISARITRHQILHCHDIKD
jgi:hypothetical protein